MTCISLLRPHIQISKVPRKSPSLTRLISGKVSGSTQEWLVTSWHEKWRSTLSCSLFFKHQFIQISLYETSSCCANVTSIKSHMKEAKKFKRFPTELQHNDESSSYSPAYKILKSKCTTREESFFQMQFRHALEKLTIFPLEFRYIYVDN